VPQQDFKSTIDTANPLRAVVVILGNYGTMESLKAIDPCPKHGVRLKARLLKTGGLSSFLGHHYTPTLFLSFYTSAPLSPIFAAPCDARESKVFAGHLRTACVQTSANIPENLWCYLVLLSFQCPTRMYDLPSVVTG
jgi:hypothetical protein